jgi:hypothetical protein
MSSAGFTDLFSEVGTRSEPFFSATFENEKTFLTETTGLS